MSDTTPLRPLRVRLQQATRKAGTLPETIEKDYAISYVLAGIAAQPTLADTLLFKGGTALKKLFFGSYRFSEDLDFSAVAAPNGAALEQALQAGIADAARQLEPFGLFALTLRRKKERRPHAGGQEAFTVHVQFPWQRSPNCAIKLEITHDERVLLPPERRRLLHDYEEPLTATVTCYRLEEVIAEKLRAALQTQQKRREGRWARPRARDAYDLWRILKEFGDTLDRECLPDLLARKCAHRGVGYTSLDDFFTPELRAEAKASWQPLLGAFVRDLPPCEQVLTELRQQLLPRLFPDLS